MPDSDAAWWSFAVAPDAEARLTDDAGRPLVNAPDAHGRFALTYPDYLGLDRVLDAQRPASSVPDERIFIVTHQLCELVFKQMTFDLAVLAATFEATVDFADRHPAEAVEQLVRGERESGFWQAALTASGRLKHSARVVLPAFMQYLGTGRDGEALFDTEAFLRFRDFLTPSSGFQTAQLRLIQRALGKGRLLDVRLFPGDTYGQHYTGCPVGHVALADPVILRGQEDVAAPSDDAPTAAVARLDETAHAVLERLPEPEPDVPPPPPVRRLHADDVERAVARFRATLGGADEAATETFRSDLERAVRDENTRRDGLDRARLGAAALHAHAPDGPLAVVMKRLAATDYTLHGPQEESFLSVHRQMARRHIHDDSGTGGGGMPYLVTSQRYLLPLCPALVAFQDLDEPG